VFTLGSARSGSMPRLKDYMLQAGKSQSDGGGAGRQDRIGAVRIKIGCLGHSALDLARQWGLA
jgi:hypothetical protein